jgi:hypothetical protein
MTLLKNDVQKRMPFKYKIPGKVRRKWYITTGRKPGSPG